MGGAPGSESLLLPATTPGVGRCEAVGLFCTRSDGRGHQHDMSHTARFGVPTAKVFFATRLFQNTLLPGPDDLRRSARRGSCRVFIRGIPRLHAYVTSSTPRAL